MKYAVPPFAIVLFCLLAVESQLSAQIRPTTTPSAGAQPEATPQAPAPEQVIINRDAMKLIDPEVFQVPLQLVPAKFISVVSPATGVVKDFAVKPGDLLSARAELFRLEDKLQELQVKRAQSQKELQQLRLEQAKKKGDADAQAVAAAELKVADVELEIAQAELEQTIVRTEEPMEVFRTYATTGELVTLYQKMLDIGDPSTMAVEIPVNRPDVQKDGTVKIKVEEQEVDAKVVAILPPAEKFEPLRGLYDSLASARLEIGNRDKKLKVGQAVYVPSIPREMVSEIPNSTIISQEEGQRKVQVIRKFVVRDILITVLAPVGADRSFVTGPFQEGDELILATSVPLADGTQLNPKVIDQSAGTGSATGRNPTTGGF